MTTLKHLLLACVLTSGVMLSSASADHSPLHNPINGLDVDNNSTINAHDALLVINTLLNPATDGLSAVSLATATPQYFVDTTDDGNITPRDALMVISHLTTVPEPSTLVLAGLASLVLVRYGWKRRRAAA